MTLDCLCLGLLCADLVCDPIDTLPKPGQLVETRRMDLSLGGCASNAAYDLAHLGVTVGVGGCVGDDFFARCHDCSQSSGAGSALAVAIAGKWQPESLGRSWVGVGCLLE